MKTETMHYCISEGNSMTTHLSEHEEEADYRRLYGVGKFEAREIKLTIMNILKNELIAPLVEDGISERLLGEMLIIEGAGDLARAFNDEATVRYLRRLADNIERNGLKDAKVPDEMKEWAACALLSAPRFKAC
jgi:hypothetical protein